MKMKHLVFIIGMIVMIGCVGAPTQTPQTQDDARDVATPDSAALMSDVFVEHAHKLPHKRISVIDFTEIDGTQSEVGKLLAEQIISHLSAIPDLKVIERKQLNKVFDEQKLGLTGVTVEDEHKIGKILNVDAIISGTVAHVGAYQEINARMIDATTGEIYAAFNHRQKATAGKQALANMPAPRRQTVDGEFDRRDVERRRHPTIRRLKEDFNRQLAAMRREDPRRYKLTVRTLRELEGLRRDHPRAYLLATEPPGSPKLRRARQQHPRRAEELSSLRRRLDPLVRTSPIYREILQIQRQKTMHRLKAKPYRQP